MKNGWKTLWSNRCANHNMDIKITDLHLQGYWNNDFIFDCYLYKRNP